VVETAKSKKGKEVEKNRSAKSKMRDRLKKKFMQEILSYLSKAASPWHAFASIYAGLSGGVAKADDLVKAYPYDFYVASMWDGHKNADYEYGRDGDYESDEEVENLEGKIAGTIEKILKGAMAIKPDPETAGESNKAELLRILKNSLREIYAEYKSKASEKEEPAATTTIEIKKALEKTSRGFETMITRSHRNFYDVKREATRMNIDDVLYGRDDGDEFQAPDQALASAGIGACLLAPEFKGLIAGCKDKINLICKKDFTALELCTSTGIDSMFATFMNLMSTSPNPRMPALPGRSGFRNYAASSGNTVYVQPQQSRYVMENSKVEIMGAYHWFRFVERDPISGVLYHTEDSIRSPSGSANLGSASRNRRRRRRYEPYESASYPRPETDVEDDENADSISAYLAS
jgi:hypothetical protein